MAKTIPVLLPAAQHCLEALGENVRLARLRRDLSAEMVAERAGISRQTLSSLENGSGSVSMATYVQVLFVLGLEKDLDLLARDDELGRKLQDAKLPIRVRAQRHPKVAGDPVQA
jgi:transcriptional regulator with XRE-family HTH domain